VANDFLIDGASHQVRALPESQPAGSETAVEGNQGSVRSALRAVWAAIKEVIVLAISAPASARVLLLLRFGLSTGFHVFQTVMTVLLKDRYHHCLSDLFIFAACNAKQCASRT
jgi:hypothetical protein